jgi:hypothetical protein
MAKKSVIVNLAVMNFMVISTVVGVFVVIVVDFSLKFLVPLFFKMKIFF